jgi:hypothetical protein
VASITSDEVRIPRHVREAVARHEAVVILNREPPVLALVHPDDLTRTDNVRGRRVVRDVAVALRALPKPDSEFVEDMDDVLRSAGPAPDDPWARS